MAMVINAEGQARDVIVVGASAGGVQALMHLLSKMPGDLPAVVGIVLHRTPYHETRLPWVLGLHAAIRTLEPDDGAYLENGAVYVAPRDQHLLFEKDRARLSRGPREHMTRPAIDPLFRSAAKAFGSRVVGVLLTGFGGDGVPGLIEIGGAGGLTLVQDPREAAHPTMPRRAIAEDNVTAVLPLDGIASTLIALSRSALAKGMQDVLAGANASATYAQSIPPTSFNELIRPTTTELNCAENAGACESVFSYPPYPDSMSCPSDCDQDVVVFGRKIGRAPNPVCVAYKPICETAKAASSMRIMLLA